MYRFFSNRYREVIVALLLVLVLVTVNSVHRSEGKVRWYDKAVIYVTAPLQSVLTYVIKGTERFFENYVFLGSVKEDNSALIDENRKLRNKLHELTEAGFENVRLKNLLSLKERIEISSIPAEVIAEDVSTVFKAIRINKGTIDGVKLAMPVLAYSGVVGQVIRVYQDYSDVLLITDPNSLVDATVEESRARGIIEGVGKEHCKLKYLNRLDDVKEGYKVVTSGLEQRFPKGIMLGTVEKVSKRKYGITQEVVIQPSVDFNKLEEVLVVTSQGFL
ncbi:MAG: rod shape-determining protein MreC [Pseudomonadota bacterium]